MRHTRIIAAAALAAAAGLALAATSSSAASKPAPSGVTNSPTATAAQTSAALNYWTPARMRAAKPYPLPTVKSAARPTAAQLAVSGKAGSVAGTTASGARAPQLLAQAATAEAPQPAAFAYPFPYVRFPVYPTSLMNSYPGSVNGKLFFRQNGGNFVCSATSVVAPSRTRVWTAGHCVADGASHWDSSAVFEPAFNNGATPFGTFAATNFTTTGAWFSGHDFSRDLGAFHTGLNSRGQTLATAVGTAGFTWNQPRDQEWTIIGYPAAPPFNGLIPWENHASTAVAVSAGSGPAATGIGSDFTGGSSGSSWRRQAGGAYVGYIGAHVDYKYNSQPGAIYSPYFDTLANSVRCSGEAAGC
jgi:V8-like Glu-specific endopeptidase